MKKNFFNCFNRLLQSFYPNKTLHVQYLIILFAFTASISPLASQVPSHSYFTRAAKNAYFFKNGDYPFEATPSWGDEDWAANGITHDKNYWYICAVNRGIVGQTVGSEYFIWKIPVSLALDQDFSNNPSVKKYHHTIPWWAPFVLDPGIDGYGHIGDIDYCIHNRVGYILAPMTSDYRPPIIAFFRASDLKLINYAILPGIASKDGVGWCASAHTNDSTLYTSKDNAKYIRKYIIDWKEVLNPTKPHDGLSFNSEKKLKDQWGRNLELLNMQGGELTEDDKLLYTNSGGIDCGKLYPNYQDGIHVFNTTNATTMDDLQRSTNYERPPRKVFCFDYNFDNSSCWGQEPEGLTIWDLNDGRAPHVKGQLHVLLDNHNFWTSNNVSLRHYKSFTGPNDITIIATSAAGVPANNSRFRSFLHPSYSSCASLTTDAPNIFLPGKTRVIFTVTDNVSVKVKDTAYVSLINEHDECSTALDLESCQEVVTNNFAAAISSYAPPISGYTGDIKDVWFKINPPFSPSFCIETYQVAGGLTNTVMQVLSGNCENLHEIGSDDNSGEGYHAKVTITNYTGSTPIYIRVTENGASNYGKFGIRYKKLGGGQNIFSTADFVSGGSAPNTILAGDANGDGKTDVIAVSAITGGLKIKTNISNGNGAYSIAEDYHSNGSEVFQRPILTGDINGDGKTDLIFSYYDSNSGVVVITKISNGNGTYNNYQQVLGDGNEIFQYPTLTGDVNGDGRTDLIFPFYNATYGAIVRTKISNGNGTYTSYADTLGDSNAIFQHPTLTGDVNGDGKIDLIFPFYNPAYGLIVKTQMSNGNGTYSYYADTLGDGNAIFQYSTLTGDVNGDGKTDLLFPFYDATYGTIVRTKMSNGNGIYTSYADTLGDGNGIFEYPVLKGDVNGDGKTDLIFVGQGWNACGLNTRVKLSNGNGTWCTQWQGLNDGLEVHDYPTLTGDISGDGKTDLIFPFVTNTEGLIISSKISNGVGCVNRQPKHTREPESLVSAAEKISQANDDSLFEGDSLTKISGKEISIDSLAAPLRQAISKKDKVTIIQTGFLLLAPNPAQSSTRISYHFESSSSVKRSIEVYDAVGRKVSELLVNQQMGSNILNTKNWTAGFYIVVLRDNGRLFKTAKLFVTR